VPRLVHAPRAAAVPIPPALASLAAVGILVSNAIAATSHADGRDALHTRAGGQVSRLCDDAAEIGLLAHRAALAQPCVIGGRLDGGLPCLQAAKDVDAG
jgi:hypothetical protein